MTLTQLLDRSGVGPAQISGDAELTGVQLDSRKCVPGTLFVCMPGMTNDSERFIPAAGANGASAAIVYSDAGVEAAQGAGMAVARIEPTLYPDSVWRLCDTLLDHPTRKMKIVGVTGTNGKTTTAWLIRDMLAALGLRAGYLGTLGFHLPGEERELSNTTPFAVELYNLLAEARDRGVEALAMEVSSHALAEKRADGVELDAAVFTNLTQDHLDFHKTMEEYEAAKWRLFTDLPRQSTKPFVGAINLDDSTGVRWAASLPGCVTYKVVPPGSEFQSAEAWCVQGKPLDVRVDRIEMDLRLAFQEDARLLAPLGGSYNVENLLSAIAGVLALSRATGLPSAKGADLSTLLAELASRVHPVPGRFEAVPNDKGIGILVDYAHTPDALEKLLDAVRPLARGRIITVFGCGGDRDRTKRPKMARAASERSDLTVVTSDNPRTEDPEAILKDVLPGIAPGRASVAIVDRREAVAYAVTEATPEDVVVIAGKGHENYQIVGRTKHPMDDRELVREALR